VLGYAMAACLNPSHRAGRRDDPVLTRKDGGALKHAIDGQADACLIFGVHIRIEDVRTDAVGCILDV
jgi:hypothetical protein